MKWLLRCMGLDTFPDFDLTVHVQDVEGKTPKDLGKCCVRLTAGVHHVRTGYSSKGIFHTTMSIHVEQGTRSISLDLLSKRDMKLATAKLPVADILRLNIMADGPQEKVFALRPQAKAVQQTQVRLTFLKIGDQDAEAAHPLLGGKDSDTAWLMARQLRKAEAEVQLMGREMRRESLTEIEVLMQACRGPLELFGNFGDASRKFVGVVGPPKTRRFLLCIWNEFEESSHRGNPMREIDLMRIRSVQVDPHRDIIFVVTYVDEHRLAKRVTFRIVDRPALIWQETLRTLIAKAHEHRNAHRGKPGVQDMNMMATTSSVRRAISTSPPPEKGIGRMNSTRLGATHSVREPGYAQTQSMPFRSRSTEPHQRMEMGEGGHTASDRAHHRGWGKLLGLGRSQKASPSGIDISPSGGEGP